MVQNPVKVVVLQDFTLAQLNVQNPKTKLFELKCPASYKKGDEIFIYENELIFHKSRKLFEMIEGSLQVMQLDYTEMQNDKQQALNELKREFAQKLSVKDAEIKRLQNDIASKDSEVSTLNQDLIAKQQKIEELEKLMGELTAPSVEVAVGEAQQSSDVPPAYTSKKQGK